MGASQSQVEDHDPMIINMSDAKLSVDESKSIMDVGGRFLSIISSEDVKEMKNSISSLSDLGFIMKKDLTCERREIKIDEIEIEVGKILAIITESIKIAFNIPNLGVAANVLTDIKISLVDSSTRSESEIDRYRLILTKEQTIAIVMIQMRKEVTTTVSYLVVRKKRLIISYIHAVCVLVSPYWFSNNNSIKMLHYMKKFSQHPRDKVGLFMLRKRISKDSWENDDEYKLN